MKLEDLNRLKDKLKELSKVEQRRRDKYLQEIASGKIYGPMVGYASIDKPNLGHYGDEAVDLEVPQMTAYEFLENCCKNNLDYTAIEYFMKKYSYKKLMRKIDIVAKGFMELGVKQGDKVVLALPNIPENVISFYALNKIGAVACLVDLTSKADDLSEAINDVSSKYLVATNLFMSEVKKALPKTSVEKVIVTSPVNSLPFVVKLLFAIKNKTILSNNKFNFNSLIKLGKKSKKLITYKGNAHDTACILRTSGTTGKAKAVELSNIALNIKPLQYKSAGFEFNPQEIFFNQVPPFLAYNIIMATHLPLCLLLTVRMLPDYCPSKFAYNVINTKANHAIAGPADWNNFLDNKELVMKHDFSRLKTMASGSDKYEEDKKSMVNEMLRERGCKNKIIEGYGATEGGCADTTNIPSYIVPSSVGIALPKTDICICDVIYDENGEYTITEKELLYNEMGEICIAGDALMNGYLNNQEATDKVLIRHADGKLWYHTGDLGKIDSDGSLYYSGRLGRIIKRHDGIKISPFKIEDIVSNVPNVRECCVVGVDDIYHDRGQMPIVNISISEDYDGNKEEVIEMVRKECLDKLKEKELPMDYYIWDGELPKTHVGKIDFKQIAKVKTRKRIR